MKHDEVFEVLEPPPHGLTRLRGRMASRRANRLMWPGLVVAFGAALALLLFVPRGQAPADFSAAFSAHLLGNGGGGAPVTTLDGSELGVERRPSSNPNVVVYRVATVDGLRP